MKTKLLLTLSALLLFAISNKNFAQLLPFESTHPAPTVVPTGGFKTAYYDKCTGILNVTMQTSWDNTNIFPIYAAFVYIKIGSTWQNMMTIRGEDSKDDIGFLQNCGAGITSGSGYTAVFNPPYDAIVSAATFTPCNFNSPPFRNDAEAVETGHVKRRVGYYNGAFNQGSWFSYEDEGICDTYSTINSDFIQNKIEFTPYYGAPNNNTGDASGIGANLLPISVYPSSLSGAWGLQFGIANIPQAAIVGNNVQIRVYVNYRNNDAEWDDASNANNKYETYQYSVAIQVPDAPVGLTASTNQCNQVTLNWSNSSQTWSGALNCINTQLYNNVIYRNGVKIGMVAGNATSYIDASGTPTTNVFGIGQTYQYSVKTILWNEGNKSFRQSNNSNIATGSMKMPPQIATNFTASENKCNGTIVLNWNQDATNLDHFDLWYSNGGPTVFTTSLSASARAYTFPTPRGVLTGFDFYSLNSCGYGPSGYAFVQGISPVDPAMATNVVATKNASNTAINVTWNDNATNETKYEIVRTDDIGNTILTQVNANQTSYIDAAAASCRVYNYKIRVYNDCVLSGITSTSQDTATLPPPNLNNTFDATHKITASKGYFSNRVELSWSNNNGLNIDIFKIYRKQLGTTLDSVQIAAPNAGSGLYVDNTADARVFYRYTIVGVKSCNGVDLSTNISSDIGFRNPTGLVSGHIEYNGGTAVNGAKVFVQQSGSTIAGNSLKFSPTGTMSIADGVKIEPGAQMRCEFWYKPTTAATGNIINKANAFSFGYNGTSWVAGIYTGGTQKTVIVPATYTNAITVTTTNTAISTQTINPGYITNTIVTSYTTVPNRTVTAVTTVTNVASNYTLTTITTSVTASSTTSTTVNNNQWQHVALVYNGSSFKTFIDGKLRGTIAATGNIDDTNTNLVFGDAASDFYLDEFRLIGQSQSDSIITFDANRIMNGDETGFKCNLHFNENVGTSAYDVSKVGNFFNENHAVFTSTNVAWSSDIPTNAQLGYVGITNNLGNYIVTGIQYLGSGENFNLVPNYQTHSFSPSSRSVYIGDGTNVFNNQDFLDISSFPVTGTLFYKGTTCPVPNAGIKLDGLPLISNGQQAVTSSSGTFSVSIPIGNHYVSVDLFNHTMEVGRYPATGTYNFQAPVSGVELIDSTKRILVGRVVGGLIEANKAPGMGRSKNNIGKAKLILVSPITGTPCFTVAVITNSLTGEYKLSIPPLDYRVDSAYVITNSVTISKTKLSNTNKVINLTNVVIQPTVIDTLKNSFGGVVRVDSTIFHKRLDFVYRSSPEINVTRPDNSKFIGEDSLSFSGNKFIIRPTTIAPDDWGLFGYPVFAQGKDYTLKVHASEIYINNDNTKKDTVLLNGNVVITNDLVDGTDPNPSVELNSGIATYSFNCGAPNTSSNSATPNLSYTKDMQIVVVPDGAASVSWEPNTTYSPSNPNYHGFVIGRRVTGTGVATQGPEKVDFILRDPPGSGSSASWTSSHSQTYTNDFSLNLSAGAELSTELTVGTKGSVGIGVETDFDNEESVALGLSTSISGGFTRGFSETVTSSYAVSTRDDADNVGAPADIFIGRSRNWYVGPTSNIELQDNAKCLISGQCFGPSVNGKKLAKVPGYAIAPGETKTRFSYTQNEIENVVIPSLVSLRNNIMLNSSSYQVIAASTHSLFGSNNDDPLWATPSSTTPAVYDAADTTGLSYIFRGRYVNKQDTVRALNTQISLWKQALAQNEREKIECLNNASFLLDNFTLGSAIVTNAYESSTEDSWVGRWELSFTESFNSTFGIDIGGNGIGIEASASITETTNGEHGNITSNANALEYTLTDGDPGDIMSVDVFKTATGNVFITRGGQTMCPYEDAVVCHYYNSSAPDAWIGSHTYNANGFSTIANATVQREMPEISITPAVQYNIPSNQPAVYQLVLTNQSPLTVNNDIDLQVRVDGANNPYGAVCKIDGQNADNVYTIPSGGSLIKTLTIERGPIEINYDSLMVIFSSACSADIADTAYVSVHFIPTCTDLNITAPTDNFIINNSNNSLSNIIIEDYNYNYGAAANSSTVTGAAHPYFGFEKIGFEFKPANSSQWLQVQDFFKYPTAVGSNTAFPIPQGQVYTQYQWTVTTQSYADGNYELRSKSYCYNKDGTYATIYSPVLQGVMDRVNPAPFGTPSPGDGILDPNDDISIQFNEPIDISSLNYAPISNPNSTFDIRGVLNGTALRHSESLNFDGTADYAEVTGGASIQKRSFTFEFWAKFNSTGAEQTVISQGTDPVQKMSIGFDAANRLKFALGTQIALSTNPITLPTDWHHYAIVHDYVNADVSLFVDGSLAGTNNNFIVDYTGSGKLGFGKDIQANNKFFNGNIHEVRMWSKARNISEITVTMNKSLSRNQSGLVYNWKMDEADGTVASDDIRSRNADIYGATWEVNPNGNAVQLDGVDDNIKVSSGNIAINKEMDFTLEFWFNSTQTSVSTLFSNGAGVANTADSTTAWTIQKDATGKIHVYHKGLDFVAATTNYFDGKWHHFALVMNRSANLSSYVDGTLQNSVQGLSFDNLAGSNMYLGAKATVAGALVTLSDYYNGKMDEFRLWSTARKTEQVKRDKQNRMLGNEQGLLAYTPFENYAVVLGTPSLTPTFNNQSLTPSITVTAQNGANLITQTPTIKLPRPIQSVNYTWALNNDKIILTTNTPPAELENVTLDITVQNAYDMRGNKMQSPKTWIAYINKNQVKWQDDEFNFDKTVDSVITFVAPIVNSGGAQKAFTIGGLPSWMTASATSGVIAPNSTKNISFTIPGGQSVGEYNAEVTVTTDFGFDEVLRINEKVHGITPTWTVNTANFQYQMNIFGQLKLDGVIATNVDSKIAAMCNGQVRGVANLQYVQAYDRYEAFLNVYSNNTATQDSIYFNIFDASTGLTFVTVDSSLKFVDNAVIGTISNPRTFSANTEIARDINLNTGWTWVSFPLKSNKLKNSNWLMTTVNATTGDVSNGLEFYDQYDSGFGWTDNFFTNGGYKNNQSYKIKLAHADTLVHIGARLNPDSLEARISTVPGWNWVGFVASKNLPVNEALSNYNATTGDLIKSQYQFAYYDNLTGWTGSLTNMKPTLGYMLKSSTTSTFSYPLSGFIGARMMQADENIKGQKTTQDVFAFTPEQYSNTMSAIINGNICIDALNNGNVAVGAFDANNNLRGFAYPTITNNTHKFYVTLYSNTSGELLNIKYFNTTDGLIMPSDKAITFNADALVGTPTTPINANVNDSLACHIVEVTTGVNELDNTTNMSVYPNPFSDNININFNKAVSAKIELVDMLGKVVYSSSFKNKKEFTLQTEMQKNSISAGMYYIRLTGDVNEQIKVIKTK